MFQKPNKIIILLFLILAVLPIMALFHPGFPLTHDGQDHVARIANFYQNLSEGVLIPRWAANLNWGYGHPILEFLYPLPSYIASFFHFVGFSLTDSTKIVFAFGMVFSLFFMYLWLCQFSSRYAALFGAVLYTYAPYRFIETYVRGDIGENLAFAFMPLVLFFIYKLYQKNDYKYFLPAVFSLSFLILAHNAISLMFVPFILVYGLFLLYLSKNRKPYFINLISLFILGFLLSAFFWMPALLEGKYTLRNIVTKGGYLSNFVSFKNLTYGTWSYGGSGQFSVQLGLFQWLSLLFSPVLIYFQKKNKNKNYWLSGLLLFYTVFAVFLMLPISNIIWSKILLLQNFQFPWRFLAITVFSTAVLGALAIDTLSNKAKIFTVAFCILIIIFISSFYWSPRGYIYKPESFFTGIYNSTTDTGESSPIWSVRFMEKRSTAPINVIDGSASIKNLKRTSTYHKYVINVLKQSLFEENTLYFPGWEIKANGTPLAIEFQNRDYRGVMTFNLGKGNYTIEAIYKETKLRLFSDLISAATVLLVFICAAFWFVKPRIY